MEIAKEYPEEIKKLIQELNYWVENGADPEHPIDNIKSKGESHSKYLDLKKKLKEKGYGIVWINNKYELTLSNSLNH